MATVHDIDRQAQAIRLVLVVLGAILTIVGWARFAGVWSTEVVMPRWVAVFIILAVVGSRVSWFIEKWRSRR